MDMMMGEQIAAAGLTDWRKLAQGLHARFAVPDFGAGARFLAEVARAGDEVGHYPHAAMRGGHVDLEVVSSDAIYRAEDGTEYVVEWVTQQDVDLARSISRIAEDLGLSSDPGAVSEVELGLDVTASAAVAPVWAALLTGDDDARGRGTPSDEIRDASGRVPNLWFGDHDPAKGPSQRLHVEVYVGPEVVQDRVAKAVAAGGSVVDDSQAPGLIVIADQEGNTGVICADTSAV